MSSEENHNKIKVVPAVKINEMRDYNPVTNVTTIKNDSGTYQVPGDKCLEGLANRFAL